MKRFLHILLAFPLILALLAAPACGKKTGTPETPANGPSVVTDGSSHFAIKADNSLWAWGSNEIAQLGDGSLKDRETPVHILDSVAQVIRSDSSTYAIKTDGSLFAWGMNDGHYNFLGDGTIDARLSPVRVMDDVLKVYPGQYRSYAINTRHELWGWGSNAGGELGDGTTETRLSPVRIMDDAVDMNGSWVIKSDNSLWHIGSFTSDHDPKTAVRAEKPSKVFEGVASFVGDSYFLTTDGRLVAAVSAGETGSGLPGFTVIAEDVREAISVDDGWEHFIIKNDNSLWGFGDNANGILGDGTTEYRPEPVHIMDDCASITANAHHDEDYGYQYVFVIKTNGELWSWGEDFCGSLGRYCEDWPECSPKLAADNCVSIVTDGWSTFIIKKDGSLWSCGYNGDGLLLGHPSTRARLGDGTTENRHEFVKILDKVNSVYHQLEVVYFEDESSDYFADFSRSFALMNDGSLYAWGYNADGLLGDGTTETALSPVKIMDGLRMP